MTTHGKNKLGPVKDDEIKKEMEGELRSGRSTRAREERELEPPGEDQPEVDLAPDTTLTGGTPPGMGPADVELRTELAQHLGRSVYPADREKVLDTLSRVVVREPDGSTTIVLTNESLPLLASDVRASVEQAGELVDGGDL